jgi:tryptophan synthase beta subunit
MGEVDAQTSGANVARMKFGVGLFSNVRFKTLKDTTNEVIRDWINKSC